MNIEQYNNCWNNITNGKRVVIIISVCNYENSICDMDIINQYKYIENKNCYKPPWYDLLKGHTREAEYLLSDDSPKS